MAGYNLAQLFTASEGTLGIITEITLKVYHLPMHRISALIPFNSIEDATQSVFELSQQDIQLGMVELMDDVMMKAINLKNQLTYPEKTTLYLEFSGDPLQIQLQQDKVKAVCLKYKVGKFLFAQEKAERDKLFSYGQPMYAYQNPN